MEAQGKDQFEEIMQMKADAAKKAVSRFNILDYMPGHTPAEVKKKEQEEQEQKDKAAEQEEEIVLSDDGMEPEEPKYTEEELAEMERQRQAEIDYQAKKFAHQQDALVVGLEIQNMVKELDMERIETENSRKESERKAELSRRAAMTPKSR